MQRWAGRRGERRDTARPLLARCCGMCAMPTASMQPEPTGIMGMMNMAEERQMDAKTRGQLLQMRGEMLKAMGDVMIRYGRVLQGAQ